MPSESDSIRRQLLEHLEAAEDLLRELRSHVQLATKQDLVEMEKRIMAKVDDLTAAATSLSTVADGLSVKLDILVTKVDAVIAAFPTGTGNLTPQQEKVLSDLKASAATAATAGDKVDAEVVKLDAVLPTPAPPAPPTP